MSRAPAAWCTSVADLLVELPPLEHCNQHLDERRERNRGEGSWHAPNPHGYRYHGTWQGGEGFQQKHISNKRVPDDDCQSEGKRAKALIDVNPEEIDIDD